MKEYRTSDIVLASCLKLNNFNLIDIEVQGTKGVFVFGDVDEQFLTDFDLGNKRVEPVSFNSTIRQLTTSVRRKITS